MTVLIELNRFMTAEDVRVAYRLPEPLAQNVLPLLPVAYTTPDGTTYHLESEVDEFFARYVLQGQREAGRADPPAPGKLGRRTETLEIANFANELRSQGKSWKEVRRACGQRWPNDERVQDSERVRATWRRHFGPARRKSD
ncbi:hypothetical protein [Limnoglobus roseus]|uniref:Uncharacterized protein n=1 Tax=Limnoglobus roseus TaxID=2598579 RepID=A0A5C1AKY9_9BACT|nr:hypothetical protein [Limnoglobus roseus]QEL17844.1 hypothetical protein PX52LOC_04855 [Limnoglobus roseus]